MFNEINKHNSIDRDVQLEYLFIYLIFSNCGLMDLFVVWGSS